MPKVREAIRVVERDGWGRWPVDTRTPFYGLIASSRPGVWGRSARSDSTPIAVRVVRNGDVPEDRRIRWRELPVRWVSERELRTAEVSEDDTLLVSSGYIGKSARVDTSETPEPIIASNFVRIVRPAGGVDPGWLFWLLGSRDALEEMRRQSAGTSILNLQGSFFKQWTVGFVPPLAEQRGIAAVLDAIDEAIERSEAVIAATEELRRSLLHELLSRGVPGRHSEWREVRGLGVVPACWEVVRLGEVAKFRSGLGARNSELKPQTGSDPFPVYGGNGIAGYWPEALVQDRAVVIGRVGQKCGVVEMTNGPAWITDNALYNGWTSERVTVDYLALMAARAGLNHIRNRNDLPLITQQIVHSVRVAVPPASEQQAITTSLDAVDATLEEARRGTDVLRSVKASASEALLSGRVRVASK